MASSAKMIVFPVIAVLVCWQLVMVSAADPDPLQDFCIADVAKGATVNGYPCKPAADATTDDFAFSKLRVQADPTQGGRNPFNATVTSGIVEDWPALNTLGLSLVRLDIAPGGVVPPHTHNLATEILFVLEGEIYTGFVANDNKLYAKTVKKGEAFIFPRGLLHFQLNQGKKHAASLNVLNGQNPGLQLLPLALFGAGIPTEVLAKSFLVAPAQVKALAAVFEQF